MLYLYSLCTCHIYRIYIYYIYIKFYTLLQIIYCKLYIFKNTVIIESSPGVSPSRSSIPDPGRFPCLDLLETRRSSADVEMADQRTSTRYGENDVTLFGVSLKKRVPGTINWAKYVKFIPIYIISYIIPYITG